MVNIVGPAITALASYQCELRPAVFPLSVLALPLPRALYNLHGLQLPSLLLYGLVSQGSSLLPETFVPSYLYILILVRVHASIPPTSFSSCSMRLILPFTPLFWGILMISFLCVRCVLLFWPLPTPALEFIGDGFLHPLSSFRFHAQIRTTSGREIRLRT